MDDVGSFDLREELVDIPLAPKEYSPAEEFALIIKSFERSLFDDRDSKPLFSHSSPAVILR